VTEPRTLWDIMDDEPSPALPYAGTSGWSGSDTSLARAIDDDTSGRTSQRQAATLESLRQAGDIGLTWKELGEIHDWHHGKASAVLSVLHKTGRIARLTERRNRCKVYVHLDHVNDRHTEPHGGSMNTRDGNQPEAHMISEHQASVLIDGHDVLVDTVARTITTDGDRREQAERAIAAVADWLTGYRPTEFGDEYCSPIDTTAFILRRGN